MTPEQAQSILDLRQKIVDNVRNGRPQAEGITPEQLAMHLDMLRQNRASATSRGGKATAAKKTAAKAGSSAALSLEQKLARFKNLDLGE